MAAVSKEEYLKRYMIDSDEKDKKKKKRRKVTSTGKHPRMQIVDDDIDFKSLLPSNLENTLEDDIGDNDPTVADFVDDRPEHVKIMERFREGDRWQVLGEKKHGSKNSKNDSESDQSPARRQRYDSDSDQSPVRRERYDSESDQSPAGRPRHDTDSDQSPAIRQRHDSDSDQSPLRSQRHDSDSEKSSSRLKHKKAVYQSGQKEHSASKPHNKRSRNIDMDQSPPRTHKPRHDPKSDRKNRSSHDLDSDQSPPRKRSSHSDTESDQSPPRKNMSRPDPDSDQSPPRKNRSSHDPDSDQSPPRKNSRHHDSDSDQSPPRKNRSRHDPDSDQSPPRRRKKKSSPTHPREQHGNKSDVSPAPRKKSRFTDAVEDTDDSSRAKTTLSGATAGLSSAKAMRQEALKIRERENNMFSKIKPDLLGKDAKTVVRHRRGKQAGEEEAIEDAAQAARKAEEKKKYDAWGKGLKQSELQQSAVDDAVHEASKPLARYRDDGDLDAHLKVQEREGDPMLEFMRKKKTKTPAGKAAKPRYNGKQPPANRFNLWPGYRWDGVNRSNGFERQLMAKASEQKAMAEIKHKWSVEDM